MNIVQAKLPSFYQLSQAVTPTSRSMNELDKIDAKDKQNEEAQKRIQKSNIDLMPQESFQLKAIPSNYDAPYQINIRVCRKRYFC